jgi:hypothetical protein
MALDVTINLNDVREVELLKLTDEHNKLLVTIPPTTLTPAQKARNILREFLDMSAQQRTDREKLGFRAVYEAATPADKAVMDELRAKYKGQ